MTLESKLQINVVRKSRDELLFMFAVIFLICVVEGIALMKGINGTLLRIALIIMACLAGLMIPTPHLWEKLKKIKEMV